MNINTRKTISIFISIILLIAFFSGCSGSSSSDSLVSSNSTEYTGVTRSIQLSEDNYDAIATEAYSKTYVLGNLEEDALPTLRSISAKTASTGGFKYTDLAHIVLSFLEKTEITEQSEDMYMASALVIGAQTVSGSCGGYATVEATLTNGIQTLSLISSFNDYCEGGVTINGDIKATGEYNLVNSSVNMSITFSEVTISSIENSLSVNGTMAMVGTISSQELTINMTCADTLTNKTYKVENMELVTDTSEFPITFTLSGKFYNPTYGSCIINTETPFTVNSAGTVTSGVLIVYDEVGASAKLTIEENIYTVEADINGDGTYELSTGFKTM